MSTRGIQRGPFSQVAGMVRSGRSTTARTTTSSSGPRTRIHAHTTPRTRSRHPTRSRARADSFCTARLARACNRSPSCSMAPARFSIRPACGTTGLHFLSLLVGDLIPRSSIRSPLGISTRTTRRARTTTSRLACRSGRAAPTSTDWFF